jgi:hypothetical protein
MRKIIVKPLRCKHEVWTVSDSSTVPVLLCATNRLYTSFCSDNSHGIMYCTNVS